MTGRRIRSRMCSHRGPGKEHRRLTQHGICWNGLRAERGKTGQNLHDAIYYLRLHCHSSADGANGKLEVTFVTFEVLRKALAVGMIFPSGSSVQTCFGLRQNSSDRESVRPTLTLGLQRACKRHFSGRWAAADEKGSIRIDRDWDF